VAARVSYLALSFEADAADAGAWADALLATGALSVDLTDPRAGTPEETPLYGEPGEPTDGGWPVCRLTALFPSGIDPQERLGEAARLAHRDAPACRTRDVAEQDWVRATQSQFAPIRAAEGLWIVPSWCAPPEPGAINLTLDPGLAFGTGSHPTTRMCLAWLGANVRPGERVLDYGCGSGILAIAAAKLGAGEVVGVDVDPLAIRASRANAAANGVRATFAHADELPPARADTYDVVVANILANPLTLLAPVLAARVRAGGRIVLSGILAAQAAQVAAAYARWFRISIRDRDEEWVMLAGIRREETARGR
jgi:ribosomal protein L11 methyltransferase